jgi:hypothetical protein
MLTNRPGGALPASAGIYPFMHYLAVVPDPAPTPTEIGPPRPLTDGAPIAIAIEREGRDRGGGL